MISTHILDTSRGIPAASVAVKLEKQEGNLWTLLKMDKTDVDGRIKFPYGTTAGNYRLIFAVEAYYRGQSVDFFFLDTILAFRVTDTTRNYHVPLLLNPYGFSSYRGS